MEESGQSQMSLVDAGARLMKSKNGFVVAYNSQTAVDVYYGENYMTPVRFAQSHEYPFYKRQEEFLNEHGIYTK